MAHDTDGACRMYVNSARGSPSHERVKCGLDSRGSPTSAVKAPSDGHRCGAITSAATPAAATSVPARITVEPRTRAATGCNASAEQIEREEQRRRQLDQECRRQRHQAARFATAHQRQRERSDGKRDHRVVVRVDRAVDDRPGIGANSTSAAARGPKPAPPATRYQSVRKS